jgi:hypothetical protein
MSAQGLAGRSAVIGCLLVGLALAARPARASLPASPGPAAQVTVYVHTTLGPRVRIIEDALATADRTLLAYCPRAQRALLQCADLAVLKGGGILATTLVEEADVLAQAGYSLDMVAIPDLGSRSTLYLMLLIEDLVICSEGLAGLMQEVAAGIPVAANVTATSGSMAYGLRVRYLVTLLRRAEGWLDKIDRETGARVTLPGFEGGQSLEEQLSLQ